MLATHSLQVKGAFQTCCFYAFYLTLALLVTDSDAYSV
jgi:hypothetical protein